MAVDYAQHVDEFIRRLAGGQADLDFTRDARVNTAMRNLDFMNDPAVNLAAKPAVPGTLYSRAATAAAPSEPLIQVPAAGPSPALATPATAPVAPNGAYKFGARAAKVAKVAGRVAAPLAGAAQIAEGLSGAPSVGNAIRTGVGIGAIVNPAVGGPIAAGMGIADVAGNLYDKIVQPGSSTILNPAFKQTVDAAGGADAYSKQVSARVASPASPADIAQNQRELARTGPVSASTPATGPNPVTATTDAGGQLVLSNVPNDPSFNLQGVPAGGAVGAPVRDALQPFGSRSGFSTADMDSINARIRAIGANPGAQANIAASAAQPRVYTKPDGSVTSNYAESEQYQSGVARAAGDKAELTRTLDAKDLEDAKNSVKFANSQATLGAAVTNLQGVRTAQAAKATNSIATAELQRKSIADQNKFLIDAITAGSTSKKNEAETNAISTRLGLVNQAIKAGTSPADAAVLSAGRSPAGASRFTAPQVLDPNAPLPVLDKTTGQVTLQKPHATGAVRQGEDGKYYVVGADGKATREATKTEIDQLKKK